MFALLWVGSTMEQKWHQPQNRAPPSTSDSRDLEDSRGKEEKRVLVRGGGERGRQSHVLSPASLSPRPFRRSEKQAIEPRKHEGTVTLTRSMPFTGMQPKAKGLDHLFPRSRLCCSIPWHGLAHSSLTHGSDRQLGFPQHPLGPVEDKHHHLRVDMDGRVR